MPLENCFGKRRVLLGVVHLAPLPGSPGYQGSMEAIQRRALDDARALEQGGMDGAIVENFGDAPFYPDRVPAETVSAMAVALAEIRREVRFPLGVNVLRNDAHAALALAAACEAKFVRVNVHVGSSVTDQGIVSGRAHETLRLRQALWARSPGNGPLLFADVDVKHAAPLGDVDLRQTADDTYTRGKADVLLVTGKGTGKETSWEDLRLVREAVPSAPILVASGVTDQTVAQVLREADGAIVGTWVKREGRVSEPVDVDRVRRLVETARSGQAAGS